MKFGFNEKDPAPQLSGKMAFGPKGVGGGMGDKTPSPSPAGETTLQTLGDCLKRVETKLDELTQLAKGGQTEEAAEATEPKGV